jgi:DNA polymerase III subunit gamma/tau
MTFIVTARKWRPKKFNEVVGQDHITTTLKNAITNNRIAHAYLFSGPRGVGKTTTARILAKALNCLDRKDGEPCGKCEMCQAIQSSQSLDIIEIDGASNRGIDEVRALRDSVKYAPTRGTYKVYIIDEVHMLTKESFNAFLKTLEEPPSHTIFIFATTDAHKVPLTIISRCQRFDFRRIQLDSIKSLLSKIAVSEKIEIDDKTLTLIAKKADGALRDAESLFDQVVSFCGNKVDSETVSKMLNLINDEIYFQISDAVIDKNFKSVFDVTQTIFENGWNFIDFMEGLVEHFRNILSVVVTKSSGNLETADIYKAKYLDYADKFTEGDILRLLNYLTRAQQELRYAQNQKLKVEISLSHLIGLERTSTISEILSNLNNITTHSENTNSPTRHNPSPDLKKKLNNYYTVPHQHKTASAEEAKIEDHFSSGNDQSLAPNEEPVLMQKWNEFVKKVSEEKRITFGDFFYSTEFGGIQENKLIVLSDNEQGKTLVKHYAEYLSNKSLEIFGKKLKLVLSKANSGKSSFKPAQNNSAGNIPPASNTDDPYVEAIIRELGGQELI